MTTLFAQTPRRKEGLAATFAVVLATTLTGCDTPEEAPNASA